MRTIRLGNLALSFDRPSDRRISRRAPHASWRDVNPRGSRQSIGRLSFPVSFDCRALEPHLCRSGACDETEWGPGGRLYSHPACARISGRKRTDGHWIRWASLLAPGRGSSCRRGNWSCGSSLWQTLRTSWTTNTQACLVHQWTDTCTSRTVHWFHCTVWSFGSAELGRCGKTLKATRRIEFQKARRPSNSPTDRLGGGSWQASKFDWSGSGWDREQVETKSVYTLVSVARACACDADG